MSQEENFKSKPKKMPLTTKLAVGAMAGGNYIIYNFIIFQKKKI